MDGGSCLQDPTSFSGGMQGMDLQVLPRAAGVYLLLREPS